MNFYTVIVAVMVASVAADKDMEVNLGRLLDNKKAFTMDDLDFYINIMSSFPDYTPVPAKTLLFDLSTDIKEKMVETVNDIEQKKIVVTNNVTAILDYIRQRSPAYATKVDTALSQLFSMVGEMKDQSQERFMTWWARLFDAVQGDNEGRARRIAKFIVLFHDAFKHLTAADKTELLEISPETFRLLDSSFADRFVNACKIYLRSGYDASVYLIKANTGN